MATKQQKKNSLSALYEKPLAKAGFLSKEDFEKNNLWASIVAFLVGVVIFVFGAWGVIVSGFSGKAPAFALTGLLLCVVAIVALYSPKFRRIYDGGSICDSFFRESESLARSWEKCIPEAEVTRLRINDPLFWGSTKSSFCFILVALEVENESDRPGNSRYVLAHCDMHRLRQRIPGHGKAMCIATHTVLDGELESIEPSLRHTIQQALQNIRLHIEQQASASLDPAFYVPLSEMACPGSD